MAKDLCSTLADLNEEEAYNQIRRYSMDNRKSMKEVADAIILSEDFSKPSPK